METLEILQNIWYVLIGFFLSGYAILDGFDLGMGSLLPFLAKDDNDTLTLFNTIWPVWDGNEVWLITGGAALFAAFPIAYATVFSGFYLALMLVLFALIFRAVSMEFWYHDVKRRGIWKMTFFLGSLLPSFLFGVALGNVIIGIPLNTSLDFTGSFFTLLRPYPLALGILGLAAILLQGSTYTVMKTEGEIQEKARALSGKLWITFVAALGLSFVATLIYMPVSLSRLPVWMGASLVIAAWLLYRSFAKSKRDFASFLMSSLSFIGLLAMAGAVHYPNLVKASNDHALNITMYNGSSTELTLKAMLIIAVLGMPIVITYTVIVYRIFKGKAGTGY